MELKTSEPTETPKRMKLKITQPTEIPSNVVKIKTFASTKNSSKIMVLKPVPPPIKETVNIVKLKTASEHKESGDITKIIYVKNEKETLEVNNVLPDIQKPACMVGVNIPPQRTPSLVKVKKVLQSVPKTADMTKENGLRSVPETADMIEESALQSVPKTADMIEESALQREPKTAVMTEENALQSVCKTADMIEESTFQSVPKTADMIEESSLQSVPKTAGMNKENSLQPVGESSIEPAHNRSINDLVNSSESLPNVAPPYIWRKCKLCGRSFPTSRAIKKHHVITHKIMPKPEYVTKYIPDKEFEDIPEIETQYLPPNKTPYQSKLEGQYVIVSKKKCLNNPENQIQNIPKNQTQNVPENQIQNVPENQIQNVPENPIENAPENQKSLEDDDNYYKCIICKKVFFMYSVFVSHFLNKHSKLFGQAKIDQFLETRTKKPDPLVFYYMCGYCNKKFNSETLLEQHHIDCYKLRFTCDICLKTFYKRSDLKKHKLRIHSENYKKHKCTQCGEQFKYLRLLKRHLNVHVNDKLADKCSKCSLQCSEHNYENIPECLCTEQIKYIRNLEKINKRQFLCEHCAKSFKVFNLLKKHIIECHIKML